MTVLRSNMGILRLKRGITAFGLEKQGGISLSTHENCGKKHKCVLNALTSEIRGVWSKRNNFPFDGFAFKYGHSETQERYHGSWIGKARGIFLSNPISVSLDPYTLLYSFGN